MAKGVASVFDLPFPASLAAMGTVLATITSVFAGIPKFASGGIFSGNSTVGDMNLARVNAGEMILNNRQQRNLFNMLNGSGASPYSTGGGNVSFEIKGDKLVGVLNNYNRKKSKI